MELNRTNCAYDDLCTTFIRLTTVNSVLMKKHTHCC